MSETVFRQTQVFDQQMDLYKLVWCCPVCGELIIALMEPPFCSACKYDRPKRLNDEYEISDEYKKEIERTAGMTRRRLLLLLGLDGWTTKKKKSKKDPLVEAVTSALIEALSIDGRRARMLVEKALEAGASPEEQTLFLAALRLHGQMNGSLDR